jgi:hypothetical protein
LAGAGLIAVEAIAAAVIVVLVVVVVLVEFPST